jgi:RNA polymerase sigma-70 factor (ECF subfamily)
MSKQPRDMTRSDADLVKEAKRGDHTAFSELVRRNEQMVYSFAFKVCRNKGYAEETFQDTFINVFRKIHQFDGRSKFSTWLYSIVSNNCLMKRRRAKLEEASVSFDDLISTNPSYNSDEPHHRHEIHSAGHTPLDMALSRELQSALDTAIQKLPVDHRLVFILRDIEGKSAGESAKILKISVPALKSRLRRARAFLREQLQEYTIS